MGSCQSIDETHINIPRQGVVREIMVDAKCWNRKYQGLFDFEARDIDKKKLRVAGDAVIIKENQKYLIIDSSMEPVYHKNSQQIIKKSIFRLIRNDNYYQLIPTIIEEEAEIIEKPIWLIIRTLPKKNYAIKERDLLKLGKQKLRVREVNPGQAILNKNGDDIRLRKTVYENLEYKQQELLNQNEKNQEVKEQKNQLKEQKNEEEIKTKENPQQTSEENTCRICLEEGMKTNPLITPCKCIGTVRHIHYLCLKSWLTKQVKAQITEHCVTINWKPMSCEMCKTLYKYRIYMDNQKFYTVDIPKPEKPYIVLQVIKRKSEQQGKIFKFISFKKKDRLNIGRKKDVDVRISDDITVSRLHATITYSQSSRQFYLEDNQSKFGTLVLSRNGLILRPHHQGISIQMGADVYSFEALREHSDKRPQNYEIGENFQKVIESQVDEGQEEEEQGSSQEIDEVMELPQEPENSPQLRRSISIRRASSFTTNSSALL